MFRNLRFYRVTSPWPDSEEKLSEILSENAFTPCGSFAERSAGWEAPGGNENDPLCRRLNGADLFQLRTQSRVLPVAAINEALEERVAEFRTRMELEPTRAEVRRLKGGNQGQTFTDITGEIRTKPCLFYPFRVITRHRCRHRDQGRMGD